jgi:hypothetical protein
MTGDPPFAVVPSTNQCRSLGESFTSRSPNAPIARPVTWKQIERGIAPVGFSMADPDGRHRQGRRHKQPASEYATPDDPPPKMAQLANYRFKGPNFREAASLPCAIDAAANADNCREFDTTFPTTKICG